jgi:endonuclease G
VKVFDFIFFVLILNLSAFSADLPENLEIPTCAAIKADSGHFVSHKNFYSLCYRENYEQSEWVAYKLSSDDLDKNTERTEDFRSDSFIPTGSAVLEDYRKSGFDRGHLAPAADFAFSEEAMSETFLMSNMSPQTAGFNRGIWAKLEKQVRTWAGKFGEIYVVTGPILEKNRYETIGVNHVAVPEFFYKALAVPHGDQVELIAFILPNQSSKQPLSDFAVPIDKLEARTGIDFFPALDDATETAAEKTINEKVWF